MNFLCIERMTDMNNISYTEAIISALEAAGLGLENSREHRAARSGELYYVSFRTDWQKYEAYVSADDGAVLGLNFEPSIDVDYDAKRPEIEYMDSKLTAAS